MAWLFVPVLVRSDTAAPIGKIEGAELLVVGAVTELEGNASGAQGAWVVLAARS
jgi:curli biogenesis system outer membrane secretion channel CsgG